MLINNEYNVNTAEKSQHLVKSDVEFYYILLYDKMSQRIFAGKEKNAAERCANAREEGEKRRKRTVEDAGTYKRKNNTSVILSYSPRIPHRI